MRSIRDSRWKLIEYRPDPLLDRGIHHTELFDLKHDPHELNNLASDPAQPDRIAKMRHALLAYLGEHEDPCVEAFTELN